MTRSPILARHSREDARAAKQRAVADLSTDADVTSVGLGMTEDRSDYAVTVTVRNRRALSRIPQTIGTVPVRAVVSGVFTAVAD